MDRSIERPSEDPDEAILSADDTGMVRAERIALEPVIVESDDLEEYEAVPEADP